MTDDQRKQFAIHELTAVLRSLEELDFPCTLIGGQAVYCWAGQYQTHDAAIQQFAQLTPFLSKDIDFQGSVQAVKDLAKKLNTRAERPGFREAFGNLLVGKLRILIGGAPLPIEILPWPELESAIEPELVALREKRLPRWRAKTACHKPLTPAHPLHLKMLAILAETAQPATSPRPSPLASRPSP